MLVNTAFQPSGSALQNEKRQLSFGFIIRPPGFRHKPACRFRAGSQLTERFIIRGRMIGRGIVIALLNYSRVSVSFF